MSFITNEMSTERAKVMNESREFFASTITTFVIEGPSTDVDVVRMMLEYTRKHYQYRPSPQTSYLINNIPCTLREVSLTLGLYSK